VGHFPNGQEVVARPTARAGGVLVVQPRIDVALQEQRLALVVLLDGGDLGERLLLEVMGEARFHLSRRLLSIDFSKICLGFFQRYWRILPPRELQPPIPTKGELDHLVHLASKIYRRRTAEPIPRIRTFRDVVSFLPIPLL